MSKDKEMKKAKVYFVQDLSKVNGLVSIPEGYEIDGDPQVSGQYLVLPLEKK